MTTTQTPRCPDCGAATVERRSNKPGVLRWFPCTRYPACKGAVREFAPAKRAPAPIPTSTVDLGGLQGAWDGAAPTPTPPPAPVGPRRIPSKYQQAIYDWIATGSGNAVVEAVAGSGKTTTMVDALALTSGRVLFTAFNAAIAKELAARAPGHVTVSTLHALGLRAVKKAVPGVVVDKDGSKLDAVTLVAFPVKPGPEQRDENFDVRRAAKRAVGLAKATLVDPRDAGAVASMLDRYGVETDDAKDLDRVVAALGGIMDSCRANTALVDFDDMVWLPVAMGWAVEKFDWVFVDETQDMNRSQLELVLAARRDGCRVVCVGDRAQSIYGFRGADCEAIPRIIERLGATVFPLSITYRCPTSHVDMARALVPAIEARPGAPVGIVRDLMLDKAMEVMVAGDLVMCRTNAPLVGVAFGLIRAGKKAIIRGREIGAGLTGLVRKLGGKGWAGMDAGTLLERLEAYRTKEMDKLTKAKKSTVTLEDKCETLRVLAEGADTAGAIVAKIETIFSDTDAGVVCSSVHRAKGFEAERTFIVSPELMPHPSAKKDWEIQSEKNIRYVALTRSKMEMVFVTIPKES